MTHRVEATGNTLEEAKQKALQMLGITDEKQVQFEVLEEGKRGLFGLVHVPARVCATLIKEEHPTPAASVPEEGAAFVVEEALAHQVLEFVQHLLHQSPFKLHPVLRSFHERYIELELVGQDVPYLIGKNGEGLDNLQYLLNLLVLKRVHPQVRLLLDGGGYRKRRAERLRNQAIAIAAEVKQRQEEAVLPPMPPHERWIIHQALKDDPDVSTYSEGEEGERRVVISPRKIRT